MLEKIKKSYEINKIEKIISTNKTTPKGECLLKYLENKINGIDQNRIEEYEKILVGRDLNLWYLILKASINNTYNQ